MHFAKYHALGNDYLVIVPTTMPAPLTPTQIKAICHRHYGFGSDGILLGPLETNNAQFGLRIFNPDGSEAEKSGNGLRIFARFLWDAGRVGTAPFTIETPGGVVSAVVQAGARQVTVDMGRVSFCSTDIPVAGPPREVLNESLQLIGREFRYCAATIGNPHCIILCTRVSADLARTYGPLIENEPRFPNRINVQFLQILDRSNIRIEIWERGAGYTLASGSSSAAAAAVAYRLGLCGNRISVQMPGGCIDIGIGADYEIEMTGPVTKIGEGDLAEELFTEAPSCCVS
jgi:diaminopimelate epimerase